MIYLRWAFFVVFWAVVAAFLHYTLPQWDVVRIIDTYEERIDPGENRWFWAQANAGSDQTTANRDVSFLQTERASGGVSVYRNEDTGWGWPPYFKFDTSNLRAEAANLRSTAEEPRWVAVRHYGWRVELWTVYPNALSIREVDGPDVRVIPWMSIAILVVLAALYWAIRVRWLRFWAARVAPRLQSVADRFAG